MYLTGMFYGSLSVALFALLSLSVVYSFELITEYILATTLTFSRQFGAPSTKRILPIWKEIPHSRSVYKIVGPKLALSKSTTYANSLLKTFQWVFHLHNQTRMLITMSNQTVSEFVPVMTAVGMSSCVVISICIVRGVAFISLLTGGNCHTHQRQFTKTDILFAYVCIFGALFVLMVIIEIIVLFTWHAFQPRSNSSKYIYTWQKYELLPRAEKKQALAMREVAYRIGPFLIADRDTAFVIGSKILDLTVTFLVGLG